MCIDHRVLYDEMPTADEMDGFKSSVILCPSCQLSRPKALSKQTTERNPGLVLALYLDLLGCTYIKHV